MKIGLFTCGLVTLLVAGCTSAENKAFTKPWHEIEAWGLLADPCDMADVPENYYRRPAFYADKAKDYFSRAFADCTNHRYSSSISIPVEGNLSLADRNRVRAVYVRALPRTWRSSGVPHEEIAITMDRQGELLDAARRGFTVRNERREDRDVIMGRFRQAGLTNYSDWSVDTDDGKQYAVAVYGYPLSDFTPLVGLPIHRLDVIVALRPLELSALAAMPLTYLQLHKTPPCDLSSLANAPLRGIELSCLPAATIDITPLVGCPLQVLSSSGCITSNSIELMRQMTNLTDIDGMPASQFWKEHDKMHGSKPSSRSEGLSSSP